MFFLNVWRCVTLHLGALFQFPSILKMKKYIIEPSKILSRRPH